MLCILPTAFFDKFADSQLVDDMNSGVNNSPLEKLQRLHRVTYSLTHSFTILCIYAIRFMSMADSDLENLMTLQYVVQADQESSGSYTTEFCVSRLTDACVHDYLTVCVCVYMTIWLTDSRIYIIHLSIIPSQYLTRYLHRCLQEAIWMRVSWARWRAWCAIYRLGAAAVVVEVGMVRVYV